MQPRKTRKYTEKKKEKTEIGGTSLQKVFFFQFSDSLMKETLAKEERAFFFTHPSARASEGAKFYDWVSRY